MAVLKERLSASFAKQLLKKPFEKIAYELKQPKEPNEAMERGNRWEYCLQNGCEGMEIWKDTATKGVKFKAWKKTLSCEPFMVVTQAEHDETVAMCNSIAPEVKHIISNSKYQNYFRFDNVHGYMDFVTDDTIYDLKISDPTEETFAKQVVNMGWDIQAYIYRRAFDFEKEFKWIVIDGDAPYTTRIYDCDQRYIDSGKFKFEKAQVLFDKFNSGDKISICQPLTPPNWLK